MLVSRNVPKVDLEPWNVLKRSNSEIFSQFKRRVAPYEIDDPERHGHGLTRAVSAKNVRVDIKLQHLLDQDREEAAHLKPKLRQATRKATMGRITDAVNSEGIREKLDEMEKEISLADRKVTMIMRRQDTLRFNKSATQGSPGAQDTKAVGKKDKESDKHMALAERLEQYKYFRRATNISDNEDHGDKYLSRKTFAPMSAVNYQPPVSPWSSQENWIERNRSAETIRSFTPQLAAERHLMLARSESEKVIRARQVKRQHNLEMMRLRDARLLEIDMEMGGSTSSSARRNTLIENDAFSTLKTWLEVMAAIFFAEQCYTVKAMSRANRKSGGTGFSGGGGMKVCMAGVRWKAMLKRKKSSGKQIRVDDLGENERGSLLFFKTRLWAKLAVRRKNRQCAQIWDGMQSWRLAGNVMMLLKRYHFKVRRMQKFWRRCKVRLKKIAKKTAKKFKLREQQVITVECKKGEQTRRASAIDEKFLSLAERVEMRCMTDGTRQRFVEEELRYRRYVFLQIIAQWRQDFKQYQHEVLEWRSERRACKAMDAKPTLKLPEMPPYPSYLPKEDDIQEMVWMARKDPQGWHSIEEYRLGQAKTIVRHVPVVTNLPKSTEEAHMEFFAVPEGFQVPSVFEPDGLREGAAYRTGMPSSTTLYAEDSICRLPTPRARSKLRPTESRFSKRQSR